MKQARVKMNTEMGSNLGTEFPVRLGTCLIIVRMMMMVVVMRMMVMAVKMMVVAVMVAVVAVVAVVMMISNIY